MRAYGLELIDANSKFDRLDQCDTCVTISHKNISIVSISISNSKRSGMF